MAAYTHQSLPLSFAFIDSRCSIHLFSKRHLFLYSKPFIPCLALSATSPTSSTDSSPQIFLPFLQRQEQKTDPNPKQQIHEDNEVDAEEEEEPIDPILKFFKSQTPTPDPTRLGKLSLQKNRRSSWHLSANIKSADQRENLSESDLDNISFENEEKQQTGSLPGSIVGEILQIARSLPENLTFGEVLGRYEERVGRKECEEVLDLMANDGLLTSCLYFYEWMRLHEPSLVSPRACSLLFPVLGRARMGDELMVLFNNLPQSKEFMDVHVYNAAISGLFCCGRYEILNVLVVLVCLLMCFS